MKTNVDEETAAARAVEIIKLFGPVAVLTTEDSDSFAVILTQLIVELTPQGMIEEQWVYDAAYYIWLKKRYRRFKIELHEGARLHAYGKLAEAYVNGVSARDANDFARACFEDKDKLEQLQIGLGKYGLTMGVVDFEAFRWRKDEYERLDRLDGAAEAQFRSRIREIAAYRKAFARKLNETSQQLVDIDDERNSISPQQAAE